MCTPDSDSGNVTRPSMDVLVAAAREAAKHAHCPYSRFHVGAAVYAGGRIFSACNVESASYGLSLCAERNAIFKAVSEGCGRIEMLAVVTPDAPADSEKRERMSCGACRQVMAEFLVPDAPIYLDGVGVLTIEVLIPDAFLLREK